MLRSTLAFLLLTSAALAQAPAPTIPAKPLAFEVVSVKPESKMYVDPENWGVTADGLRVNGQLSFLIRTAFGAQFFDDRQIVGEPSWCDSDAYDIVAKVGYDDMSKLHNLNPQQRTQIGEAMLQAVLADRFKMKIHQESREGSIFELVVANKGPKLREASPGDKYTNGLKLPNGHATGAGTMTMSPGRIVAQGLSLDDLATLLSGPATGRVVTNKTTLSDKYDFTLTWTPDQPVSPGNVDRGSADIPGPSIFTAVQEQLGLKLQPAKGPVPVLVVDHIDKPSDN